MSTVLTDEDHSVFEQRLGAAHVELMPCHEDVPDDERRYWLFARCTVGDWSKDLQVRHVLRLDRPGEARDSALSMLTWGFYHAAPHLFPVSP